MFHHWADKLLSEAPFSDGFAEREKEGATGGSRGGKQSRGYFRLYTSRREGRDGLRKKRDILRLGSHKYKGQEAHARREVTRRNVVARWKKHGEGPPVTWENQINRKGWFHKKGKNVVSCAHNRQ